MEIIERGTLPSDRVHEGRCDTCRTKVRFKQSEAKYVPDQRDGDFLQVGCPVCGQTITVSL